MLFIKEIPKIERPREKLLNNGVSSLTNLELIALLLRSGNSKYSVIELSKTVLNHIEKLQDLKLITVNELMKIPGIKTAKATTLIAAIELGKRLEKVSSFDYQIKSSDDIYNLMKYIATEEQENFYCIYLNTKMFVIKYELIYKGTVNEIVIHPREVFKNAIKANATAMILVHNHPSGDSNPSNADIKTTKILMEASNIIHIDILDHIIIGKNQYYSFLEKEVIKKMY